MEYKCNRGGFCDNNSLRLCGLVTDCKYKSEDKTVCAKTPRKRKPPVSTERSGERGAGLKYDGGKPRWTLLMRGFPKALRGFVDVLGFGAKKYAAHSWRGVENGPERYRDALYRHLSAIEQGEWLDPESGQPHWNHVMFCVACCYELELGGRAGLSDGRKAVSQ